MIFFKNFDSSLFLKKLPPCNNSMVALKELNRLKNTKTDLSFVKYHDDIHKPFNDLFKQNKLDYPREFVQTIIDESSDVIMKIKKYFNRPRPHMLAPHYGIKLDYVDLQSAKSPSFPSGHAAQGRVLARIFSSKYPTLAARFMKAGDNIGLSRKIAKVHYDSDIEAGRRLGDALFNHIKNNKHGEE
tara:strand:+ start:1129 stop:1686 length:558 start_codon:yes stop_codon:yes gene_type:complete